MLIGSGFTLRRRLPSINHEFNSFTVREIAGPIESTYRHEYWLQRGYVEELFTFRGAG